jgi:hypothetical protein
MSREVVQIEDVWTDPLYEQKAAVKIPGGCSPNVRLSLNSGHRPDFAARQLWPLTEIAAAP